jgi:putative endonuclease
MPYCYILYSPSGNEYYTGFTQTDLNIRLEKHQNGFYDESFTKKNTDWEVFLVIECLNNKQALQIEKHIKKMKSKTYITNLKKYPEMVGKLKQKYLGT